MLSVLMIDAIYLVIPGSSSGYKLAYYHVWIMDIPVFTNSSVWFALPFAGRKSLAVLQDPPAGTRLTSKLTNATELRGESLLLNCSTDANLTAHVYFLYFNGTSSGNSSSGFFNITVEEDGVYSCVPLNEVGIGDSDALNVSVVFAPGIDHAPPAYQVLEQRGVTLFCNATGSPQPSITWTKRGNASELSTSETLNLTKLKREDDGSVYKCTATNSVGSAQALVRITVLFAPDIDHAPSAYQVVEGNELILFCNATGNPKPNITWTKQGNSKMLSPSETLNREIVTREDDESVYICLARNSMGSVQTTANVTVL
ncbi:peroxidasin-like [Stylophora pistillata]|uniref:peroxidasin-like n=1 Tax=Stylophora pistillata TaxID=50429 RepID=UPI000C049179|nr:peroxidasin-like [Stylophora pistillata]